MPINECPSFCLARSAACFGISLIHLCVIVVICETMSGKDHGTCPEMVGHLLSLHMYGWIPCAVMMILALLLTFGDRDCDPCADIMFNVAWAFLVLVYIAWWFAAVALFTVVLILMLIYSVIIIGAFIGKGLGTDVWCDSGCSTHEGCGARRIATETGQGGLWRLWSVWRL